MSFLHRHPAPLCLQEQTAVLRNKQVELWGTWMDVPISSARVVLLKLNIPLTSSPSHQSSKAKGSGANQFCGGCCCCTGLHAGVRRKKWRKRLCETTEILCSCHWQALLSNSADKPCQSWERLFAWLNSRLKHLGGENQVHSWRNQDAPALIACCLCILTSFCLKNRAAAEVLTCHRSNL